VVIGLLNAQGGSLPSADTTATGKCAGVMHAVAQKDRVLGDVETVLN